MTFLNPFLTLIFHRVSRALPLSNPNPFNGPFNPNPSIPKDPRDFFFPAENSVPSSRPTMGFPNNFNFPQRKPKTANSVQTAQIHFSYVSSRKEPVSHDTLFKVFSKFGNMLEIVLKKTDYNLVSI